MSNHLALLIAKNFVVVIIFSIFGYSPFAQVITYAQKSENSSQLYPNEALKQRSQLVSALLMVNHYKKIVLTDSLSEIVFNNYVNSLDESKLYFLENDINTFKAYKFDYDDYLREGELDMPFMVYRIFTERFHARMAKNYELLDKAFDFSSDEYFENDRENAPWAKTEEELDEVWRKYLKSQVLNIKLSGKSEKGAANLIKDRFQRYEKSIRQNNEEDVFQVLMNALAQACDPHTNYFSPIDSDNFKIRMHKSLEGIGATLRTENDYTKVIALVPGGPAYNSKALKVGDRILAVGQGDTGEMVDVVGWRLDDVVDKIRGAKGTKVRLHILSENEPSTSTPRELVLVRDKITLEEQSAEKKLYTYQKDGKIQKIGVISIPSFYLDFDGLRNGEKNYKSTSRDVKKLIQELQSESIDGLVIDLRDNGGGALLEAVALAGMFIPEGPIVQVKNADGTIDIANDPDKNVVYSGPLTVLVNRFSASASEIFAGAIQDYKRGVIVGEQTYGKGTVQNVVDLGRYIPEQSENQGHINLTLSKFYRITGSSTQHQGVTPDISFPSLYSAEIFGESSEPNALPWDEINSTSFKSSDMVSKNMVDKLYQNYLKRLQTDKEMQRLTEEIRWENELRNKKSISLNEQKLKEEKDKFEAKRKELSGGDISNQEIVPINEIKHIRDPYLRNSIEILSDLIMMKMG
ncbi:MAG: carboxy terminal-processing peptidase [Flammeovirgaceae bacterium]